MKLNPFKKRPVQPNGGGLPAGYDNRLTDISSSAQAATYNGFPTYSGFPGAVWNPYSGNYEKNPGQPTVTQPLAATTLSPQTPQAAIAIDNQVNSSTTPTSMNLGGSGPEFWNPIKPIEKAAGAVASAAGDVAHVLDQASGVHPVKGPFDLKTQPTKPMGNRNNTGGFGGNGSDVAGASAGAPPTTTAFHDELFKPAGESINPTEGISANLGSSYDRTPPTYSGFPTGGSTYAAFPTAAGFNPPSPTTSAAKTEDMFATPPTYSGFPTGGSTYAAFPTAPGFNPPSPTTSAAKTEDMFATPPTKSIPVENHDTAAFAHPTQTDAVFGQTLTASVPKTDVPVQVNDPPAAFAHPTQTDVVFGQTPPASVPKTDVPVQVTPTTTVAPTRAVVTVETDAVDRFMANHVASPTPAVKPKLTLPPTSPHDMPLGGGFGGLDPAGGAHKYMGRH